MTMTSYWNTNDLPSPPAHVLSYNNLRECLKQPQEIEWNDQCMKHYFRIYKTATRAAAEGVVLRSGAAGLGSNGQLLGSNGHSSARTGSEVYPSAKRKANQIKGYIAHTRLPHMVTSGFDSK